MAHNFLDSLVAAPGGPERLQFVAVCLRSLAWRNRLVITGSVPKRHVLLDLPTLGEPGQHADVNQCQSGQMNHVCQRQVPTIHPQSCQVLICRGSCLRMHSHTLLNAPCARVRVFVPLRLLHCRSSLAKDVSFFPVSVPCHLLSPRCHP